MTEAPDPNSGQNDPLQQEVTRFLGVLAQGNPVETQRAIMDIRSRYNESVLAIVLDEAGKQIAVIQRAWMIAASSWYQSLQIAGYRQETLPHTVAAIKANHHSA